MARTVITLRTAALDERTYSVLGAPPTEFTVAVQAARNNVSEFDADYEFNERFGGKTYTRVGETLRYDEVV